MWIAAVALSALVALVFGANGLAKLLGHPKMLAASHHPGYSVRSFPIIGLLEVLGALGILLAPLYVPLSVAAATGLILLTIGGFIAHLRASDPIRFAPPARGCARPARPAFGLQIVAS